MRPGVFVHHRLGYGAPRMLVVRVFGPKAVDPRLVLCVWTSGIGYWLRANLEQF